MRSRTHVMGNLQLMGRLWDESHDAVRQLLAPSLCRYRHRHDSCPGHTSAVKPRRRDWFQSYSMLLAIVGADGALDLSRNIRPAYFP
jgi:hypothetical protein